MEKHQEIFIKASLDTYNKTHKNTDISVISTKTIRDILTKKYLTAADMKAVSYLFNTLILRGPPKGSNKTGLLMPDSVKEWLTNMQKISTSSIEGYVYITDIYTDDVKVIIKVPQKPSEGTSSIIREYYIGLMAINKLRYIVPTFVYTLGGFICNDSYTIRKRVRSPITTLDAKVVIKPESCTQPTSPFIITELIPGNSMKNALESKSITFDIWLLLFAQILLGLEVAQREVNFTHFDLHTSNVMIRTDKDIKYTVPLDNMTYNVQNTNHLPVIIDFGQSTITLDGNTVGSFDFPVYGMMNFMVPGYDIYKFLCSCISNAEDLLKYQIINLFALYGEDDPYNIVTTLSAGVEIAISEYCSRATFSKVASYTPLMFFKLLYAHPKYYRKLEQNITVKYRHKFIPIQISSTIQQYDTIIGYPEEGRRKAIELTEKYAHANDSYTLTAYNINILTNYNKFLKSSKIRENIAMLRSSNTDNKVEMDLVRLERVFAIVLPSQSMLDKAVRDILDVQLIDTILLGRDQEIEIIENKENKENIQENKENKENIQALSTLKLYKDLSLNILDKKRTIKELKVTVAYLHKLQPYLQFYYTILELELQSKYSTWLSKFRHSNILDFYQTNIDTNNRAMRWAITLSSSIV